jgi:hypothetical protein
MAVLMRSMFSSVRWMLLSTWSMTAKVLMKASIYWLRPLLSPFSRSISSWMAWYSLTMTSLACTRCSSFSLWATSGQTYFP